MSYKDDMTALFVANHSYPFPVQLEGLGFVNIIGGAVTPADRPTSSPWLRLSFTGGSTSNATIGTSNTRLKREPFNVDIQIFVPRTTWTSETIYTYSLPDQIERALDAFMITDGFSTAGEEGTIYSAQDEPKFKNTPSPSDEDTWLLTFISYQYLYQYV